MASLDKAFKILDVLSRRAEPFRLTELARAAELDKGTTHRLLEALIEHGFVNRSADAPKYELSLKLWTLGCRVVAQRSVVERSFLYLNELVEMTGETVYLTVCDNLEAVYVARIDSPMLIRAHTPMGGRVPLYAGSTGKALLAYLAEREIALVGQKLTAFTPHTITGYNDLLKELAHIRATGYAVSVGEWDVSISGVAAPVFGPDGVVAASLGVTGPVDRLGRRRLERLGPAVAATALRLSQEIGFQEQSLANRRAPAANSKLGETV